METKLEDQVLTFEDGIPGFPESKRFVLVDLGEDSAFQYLQSVDDPDTAMIVAVPWLFFPKYAPEVSDAEQEELGLTSPEDVVVFCPVTLDAENNRIFLNLVGPFVVNFGTRRGMQLILAGSEYQTRTVVDVTAL